MAKKQPDLNDKIATAALQLAAKHGWDKVTLEQIGKAAKIPTSQMRHVATDKDAVLGIIVKRTDAMVKKHFAKTKPDGSPRDRLFDVMMARFDVLQSDRKAFVSIMASVRKNPAAAKTLLPALTQSMKSALEHAGISSTSPTYPASVAGLGIIHGLTACTWVRDESKDLSKTMAVLDKLLSQAERLLDIFCRAK